ncbi:MAG: DUF1194 domain-containing protein [Rhodospirillales bacterium]
MEGPLNAARIVFLDALLAFLPLAPATADTRPPVELELVIAIDLSASVNDAEYELQRAGSAEAFRDPDVIDAIVSHPAGIAVIAVQWASAKYQRVAIPWTVLRTEQAIVDYADAVAAMPRKLPGGGTSITGGLRFSGEMFADSPVQGRRRVIDIAANGRADMFEDMRKVRKRLLDADIVINALAIEEDTNDLTRYFREFVIGGERSFVQTAWSFEDFREAMRAKLLREIGSPHYGALDAPADGPDDIGG